MAAGLTYGMDFSMFNFSGAMIHAATKCKMIWGNSIQNSVPLQWKSHLEAIKKGLKLIVIDPRRTEIASKAYLHLQLRPGTDGALALGMINIIIGQNLYDKEFVAKWTVGFDDLKEMVKEYTPEKVEEITGVPAAKIQEAALLYATTKPAQMALSGNSTTHHTNGVQNHRAIILLPAITGNFDVTGGNKCVPPGKQKNDITLHDQIDKMPPGVGSQRFPIWTKFIKEMQTNALADQIESGRPYPIKALFSSGLNVQFFANSTRMEKMMEKLDFIAVTEYFQTPGTRLADIVLPIASWLEREILIVEPEKAILIEPAIIQWVKAGPNGKFTPNWLSGWDSGKNSGMGICENVLIIDWSLSAFGI